MEVNVTEKLYFKGEPLEYEKFVPGEYLKNEKGEYIRNQLTGSRIQLKDPEHMDLRYVLSECLYRSTKKDLEMSAKEILEHQSLAKRILKNDLVQMKSSEINLCLERVPQFFGKGVFQAVHEILEKEEGEKK